MCRNKAQFSNGHGLVIQTPRIYKKTINITGNKKQSGERSQRSFHQNHHRRRQRHSINTKKWRYQNHGKDTYRLTLFFIFEFRFQLFFKNSLNQTFTIWFFFHSIYRMFPHRRMHNFQRNHYHISMAHGKRENQACTFRNEDRNVLQRHADHRSGFCPTTKTQ